MSTTIVTVSLSVLSHLLGLQVVYASQVIPTLGSDSHSDSGVETEQDSESYRLWYSQGSLESQSQWQTPSPHPLLLEHENQNEPLVSTPSTNSTSSISSISSMASRLSPSPTPRTPNLLTPTSPYYFQGRHFSFSGSSDSASSGVSTPLAPPASPLGRETDDFPRDQFHDLVTQFGSVLVSLPSPSDNVPWGVVLSSNAERSSGQLGQGYVPSASMSNRSDANRPDEYFPSNTQALQEHEIRAARAASTNVGPKGF